MVKEYKSGWTRRQWPRVCSSIGFIFFVILGKILCTFSFVYPIGDNREYPLKVLCSVRYCTRGL